jgi:hypothetical protein
MILHHKIVRGWLELVRGDSVARAKSLPTCTMEELATVFARKPEVQRLY